MADTIIPAIAILGGMGLLFGFGLAYIARKLAVTEDEKVEEIMNILPGADCGACGCAGCKAFARELAAGKRKPSECVVGGKEVALKLASLLGTEAGEFQPKVAQLFCMGGREESGPRFSYIGITTCEAANLVGGGFKKCEYGCLGFGDCVAACQFGALSMDENGLPVIDREKCVGCGACVKACPRGLISLVPEDARVFVRCSSKASPGEVTKACTVGCIGCRRCEKACEYDAIHVDKDTALASIDYTKCTACGACVEVCPRKIIEIEEIEAERSEAA
ncbi:RnfABCDGE type electron transport complex subunit B [Candidatus Poribacteria bacterium]|nr:RnfABCDGE type electron transport complex subunit B [Candidatus Poribacteria bacterium]